MGPTTADVEDLPPYRRLDQALERRLRQAALDPAAWVRTGVLAVEGFLAHPPAPQQQEAAQDPHVEDAAALVAAGLLEARPGSGPQLVRLPAGRIVELVVGHRWAYLWRSERGVRAAAAMAPRVLPLLAGHPVLALAHGTAATFEAALLLACPRAPRRVSTDVAARLARTCAAGTLPAPAVLSALSALAEPDADDPALAVGMGLALLAAPTASVPLPPSAVPAPWPS